MSHSLIIRNLSRRLANGEAESLKLSEGVNVIAGSPNTGKTTWLEMLNYLFGDSDKPEESFASSLTDKYESISAELSVGGDILHLERRWSYGYRSKVLVNEEKIAERDFSRLLLEKLELPVVYFPKGNPASGDSWPELSWRVLLRHIYRNEDSWGDTFASKQRESEQHAALTYFLGLASNLFPEEWEEVFDKQSSLRILRARKEQFVDLIEQFSADLLTGEDSIEFVTPEQLNDRIRELTERREALVSRKEAMVKGAIEDSEESGSEIALGLSRRYAAAMDRHKNLIAKEEKISRRLGELRNLEGKIKNELANLARTRDAGSLLADLKITHCPACDQEVDRHPSSIGECFLCLQEKDSSSDSDDRLEFEQTQLERERDELLELIAKQEKELATTQSQVIETEEHVNVTRQKLQPMRNEIAGLVNLEVSDIDSETGRIDERLSQLKRFLKLLNRREELAGDIQNLKKEVAALEARVKELQSNADLIEPAEHFTDEMLNYFSEMNRRIDEHGFDDDLKWKHGRPRLKIKDRSFRFEIGGMKWTSQVGGTNKYFFMLAYSYALLALTKHQEYNYPGLLILDFPPEWIDKEKIGSSENYLLEPFIKLCKAIDQPTQVIVSGRAFIGLESNQRIDLERVYSS